MFGEKSWGEYCPLLPWIVPLPCYLLRGLRVLLNTSRKKHPIMSKKALKLSRKFNYKKLTTHFVSWAAKNQSQYGMTWGIIFHQLTMTIIQVWSSFDKSRLITLFFLEGCRWWVRINKLKVWIKNSDMNLRTTFWFKSLNASNRTWLWFFLVEKQLN